MIFTNIIYLYIFIYLFIIYFKLHFKIILIKYFNYIITYIFNNIF